MPIYQVFCREKIYYTLFIKADKSHEAIDFVKTYPGNMENYVVDADDFEIIDYEEVNKVDAYFPIIDVKEEG